MKERTINTNRMVRTAAVWFIAGVLALTGCGKKSGLSDKTYKAVDMSGYSAIEGSDADGMFLDMTVKDVVKEMEKGTSFVLYTGYAGCSWCNALLPYLVEQAKAADMKIGYLDLRKDPSWRNNLDVDDYDLFVKHFGGFLPTDKEGRLHLYSPHVFFVKDGKAVEDHQGTVLTQENATDPLKPEEKAELREALKARFDNLKK